MSTATRPLILVVDDDATMRRLVAMIVARRNADTICVESCEQALAELQQNMFSLVLMDWTLPKQSGLQCAQSIRAWETGSGRRIPLVAMTAHLMPGDREACLEAGMDDFIGKPFTMSQLNNMLDRWLGDGVALMPFLQADQGDQPAVGGAGG